MSALIDELEREAFDKLKFALEIWGDTERPVADSRDSEMAATCVLRDLAAHARAQEERAEKAELALAAAIEACNREHPEMAVLRARLAGAHHFLCDCHDDFKDERCTALRDEVGK